MAEFLAIPWLRSRGFSIKLIDTKICQAKRWYSLPRDTRSVLEKYHHDPAIMSIVSPDFGVGEVRWRKGSFLRTNSDTYQHIRNGCEQSAREGYFCYDEMFVWAGELMDKIPGVADVLRDRFPLLYIDEAQDNSEEQSVILHHVFMAGDNPVIRQRFGDPNQAIFNFVGAKGATKHKFPSGKTKELPNSHRFGEKIAQLAGPLGVTQYDGGLIGHGPSVQRFTRSQEGRHTILFFGDDVAGEVLEAYGSLLLDTFSEQELCRGTFVAVGQVHKPKGDDRNPRHVGHYWPDYDPELSKPEPKPRTLVQYVFAGQGKAEAIGEAYPAVEKIAEGILRLAGMAEGGMTFLSRRLNHRQVMSYLEESAGVRERYLDLVAEFAASSTALNKEAWNDPWRETVRGVGQAVAGSTLSEPDVENFLQWKDNVGSPLSPSDAPRSSDNIYRYSRDGRHVAVRVGSIHSVKGETHTATLVLETFWQDKKGRHNLELLLPWLNGGESGAESAGKDQTARLKLHYVAMTRPTHLLCLAMKRSTLDQSLIGKLESHGWRVKEI